MPQVDQLFSPDDIDDILIQGESNVTDIIDPEPIIEIDIDGLDKDSQLEAQEIIGNLSKLYYDDEFIKQQPAFKKRVDAEIESLRINLKMRKSDEIAHDACLKKICQNTENASMYKALTDLQRTIISITSKIDESLTRLSNMMKGYQQELNFDQPQTDDEPQSEPSPGTYKGSKAFINAMINEDTDSEE